MEIDENGLESRRTPLESLKGAMERAHSQKKNVFSDWAIEIEFPLLSPS